MKELKLLSDFLFSFRGRISRRYWWMVQLFLVAPTTALFDWYMEEIAWEDWQQFVGILFGTVVVFINMSICAKRYHDTGKSGWHQLIGIIPFIGWVWLLLECGFPKGHPEKNQYGYPDIFGKRSLYYRPQNKKTTEPAEIEVHETSSDIYS